MRIFRLGDPGLARFIDRVARGVEGHLVLPDLDGPAAEVLCDYLRSRRRVTGRSQQTKS